MSKASEYFWYIPNQTEAGHRGDSAEKDHNSLETLSSHVEALDRYGWRGALLGTSWGRPDPFTVGTALAVRSKNFTPLIAIRPGYWRPAHFASSAATLDHLTNGRVHFNIVSGQDNLAAYGDSEGDQAQRYGRTKEFMRLIRRLSSEGNVTFKGEHFEVANSTVELALQNRQSRPAPKLYFGGASEAAEKVSATEADVQLFWGEPLGDIEERIQRLKELSKKLDRDLPPLEFGLRITTFVRDTTEQAWADAEAKIAKLAETRGLTDYHRAPTTGDWKAVGQQRLIDLQGRGDVLDDNLYTAPARVGGGGAGTTWLVGSAQDVANSLLKYQALGVSHFILSDTPYLPEIKRQGAQLLPLLQGQRQKTDAA